MWGFCSVVVQGLDCMVVHAVLPIEKSGDIYPVYSVNSSAQTTHNSWPHMVAIHHMYRSTHMHVHIQLYNNPPENSVVVAVSIEDVMTVH